MQKYSQNTLHMSKRSGYEKKLEEKMFLHVLAANPPNLMKKEQKKKNYNHLLTTTKLHVK